MDQHPIHKPFPLGFGSCHKDPIRTIRSGRGSSVSKEGRQGYHYWEAGQKGCWAGTGAHYIATANLTWEW